MHTLTVDNTQRRQGPLSTRAPLYNRSHHVWWNMPDRPACWLSGHRPEVQMVGGPGPARNGVRPEVASVRCSRCHARPTLPSRVQAMLLQEGWVPSPEWLADQDGRNGWTRSAGAEAEASVQLVVPGRPTADFELSVRIGTLGSETPLHVHGEFLGAAFYASTSVGRKLAHRITRGRGRQLAVGLDRGYNRDIGSRWVAEWKLWIDSWGETTGTSRETRAPWRSGRYALPSPAQMLWGRDRYDRVDVGAPVRRTVDLDDGLEHHVSFQLERIDRGRERAPRSRQSTEWWADWSIVDRSAGIGCRREGPAGLWLRDRTFGASVSLTPDEVAAPDGGWVDHAVAELQRWTRQRRARHDSDRSTLPV